MKPINIIVKRELFTDGKTTIGKMYINNFYVCDTLEDIPRAIKIYAETAIPAGTYEVKWTKSPRTKPWWSEPGWTHWTPEIMNVPGFSGIRIHSGTSNEDTKGCLLIGIRAPKRAPYIYESRTMRDLFYKMIIKRVYKGGRPCYITFQNASKALGASLIPSEYLAAYGFGEKPTRDFEGATNDE